MSAILCDEGGSPVIGTKGDILMCTGLTRALQQIHNILSTYIGSEVLFPDYGMDFGLISKLSSVTGRAMIIQAMITEALKPEKHDAISELNNVMVTILGGTAFIDIKFNVNYETSVSLNVN